MFRTVRQWSIFTASALLVVSLTACGGTSGTYIPTPAPTPVSPMATTLLKPGDHIDTMLLINQQPTTEFSGLADYCGDPNTSTPKTNTVTCSEMPRLTLLAFGPGWYSATQQELDGAWSALEYKVAFDGQELDLPAFGTQDANRDDGRKQRSWRVWIKDLTPGNHSIHIVYHITHAFKDSMDDMAMGDYDTTYQFTVKK